MRCDNKDLKTVDADVGGGGGDDKVPREQTGKHTQ